MLLLTFASFYLLVWIFSWESLPRHRSFIQLPPIRQPHFFIISVFNFLSNFLWEYILLIESLMNWLSSSSILCKNTRNFIDFWFTFNFRMIKRVGDLHFRGHLWVLLVIVILILNFRVIIKTLKFIIFKLYRWHNFIDNIMIGVCYYGFRSNSIFHLNSLVSLRHHSSKIRTLPNTLSNRQLWCLIQIIKTCIRTGLLCHIEHLFNILLNLLCQNIHNFIIKSMFETELLSQLEWIFFLAFVNNNVFWVFITAKINSNSNDFVIHIWKWK